jgi:hypothetical protein
LTTTALEGYLPEKQENSMKKTLAVFLMASLAILAFASEYLGEQMIADPSNGTASCTNYYGWAYASSDSASATTNDAKWKIIRTILDSSGNVVGLKNSQGSGINPEYSTAWTNRVSATYK